MRRRFVEEIARGAADPAVRFRYVQWCRENGLEGRADHLASSIALESDPGVPWYMRPDALRHYRQVRRCRVHQNRWAMEEGLPRALLPHVRHRNGFGSLVNVTSEQLARLAIAAGGSYPIEEISTDLPFRRLLELGALRGLQRLCIDSVGSVPRLDGRRVQSIPLREIEIPLRVSSPSLSRLAAMPFVESVALSSKRVTRSDLLAMSHLRRIACVVGGLEGPPVAFPALESLDIVVDVDAQWFETLAGSLSGSSSLTDLSLQTATTVHPGLPYLLPSRFVSLLRTLPLRRLSLPWGVGGVVRTLLDAGILARLKSLQISLHRRARDAAKQLTELFAVEHRITSLLLDLNVWTGRADCLAEPVTLDDLPTSRFPHLRRLRLNTQLITQVSPIAWCAGFPELVMLELVNRTDAMPLFEALCRGKPLEQLAYLGLTGANLPPDAAQQLARVYPETEVSVKRQDMR